MAREKILVVDDEADIVELVRYNLAQEGFEVICASSGEAALEMVSKEKPSLVVLDLMLVGISGLKVCKRIKGDPATKAVQVVMLTAKGEDSDIVTGIEAGADDYVTKPFSPKVLIARVKLALRKAASQKEKGKHIEADEIVIDTERFEVLVEGKPVEMTFTEFNVLLALARHRGRVFSRYDIMDAVRGDDYIATERAIDVQITAIRKKIAPFGKYIETVRGVGYRFRD